MAQPALITQLLVDWRNGSQEALDRLMPLVYDTMHGLARRYMREERTSHTLQATALVNEAYLKLVDIDVAWQDRAHFIALAARLMRRILVDHAKSRLRGKRGGDVLQITFNEELIASQGPASESVLDVHNALEQLAEFDPRKAEIAEMYFFGGMTQAEAAEVLKLSRATIDRELQVIKAWLARELKHSADDDTPSP